MKKITLLFAMVFVAMLSYGQIAITPLWEFSVAKGNLGTAVDDVKNGFAVSADGTKLYLSTRASTTNQVAIYNAATGERTGYLAGLNGFASTYGGDIAVDDNGAIYASNVIISETGALMIAKWDSETSTTPTIFINTTNHTGANTPNRIGYGLDVNIDASGNGWIVMHKGGTNNFLLWQIEANEPKTQDPLIVTSTGATITDQYTRISFVDATHFWVDGNVALPVLCTITALPEELPLIAGTRITTRSDINVGVGGAAEFTLAGNRYAVFAGNNHSIVGAYQPGHHAVVQQLAATGTGTSGPVIAKLPENGLGSTTDATHFVEAATYVANGEAFIYLLGGTNGIAAYKVVTAKTFTVTVPQGTEKVYIAGSFTGKDWDIANPLELTPTSNPNEFAGTFPCADDVEYKYLSGVNNWDYQEASNLGSTPWDPVGLVEPTSGSNRTYNAADVVNNWVAQPKVKLNVSFAADYSGSIPTQLFVKGSWDGWTTPIELTASSAPLTVPGVQSAPKALNAVSFTGAIGNGTTDVIYSNVAYKYFTDEPSADNWELRSSDRWSIYPLMNDEIANFVTNIPTGVDGKTAMEVKVLRTPTGIAVQFEGEADIELYGVNGQLIDKTRAIDNYTRDLNSGNYIIRVNGKSQKFVR